MIFMNKYILLFLIVNVISEISLSQSNKSVIKFQAEVQIGPLDGQRGTYVQLQSVNGISYKGYFLGIGTGLDYYFMRSIPLFLELKKNLFNKANTPFIYADGGLEYPWPSNNDKLTLGEINARQGYRFAAGIGYQFAISNKSFLEFNAGYSYKQIKENVLGYSQIFDPRVDWLDYTQHYSYNLNRLSVNIGLIF
jgi:hypothetical protein